MSRELDPKDTHKTEFYARQFIDAIAPSNFVATNPEVLKATLETGGTNLVSGLANMLEDLERGEGRLSITMTANDAFQLVRTLRPPLARSSCKMT